MDCKLDILSNGQLGFGHENDTTIVTIIPFSQKIVQIAAGLYHSMLLSDQGDIFAFGSNKQGQYE